MMSVAWSMPSRFACSSSTTIPSSGGGYVMLFGESDGFEVVGEAEDGADAIEAFERLRPDVTVLDLSLPRVSGWDVLTRVRQIDPDARVLIVSVCGDQRDQRRARDAGAHAYLLKECAADEVIAAVRAMAPPPRSEGAVST